MVCEDSVLWHRLRPRVGVSGVLNVAFHVDERQEEKGRRSLGLWRDLR